MKGWFASTLAPSSAVSCSPYVHLVFVKFLDDSSTVYPCICTEHWNSCEVGEVTHLPLPDSRNSVKCQTGAVMQAPRPAGTSRTSTSNSNTSGTSTSTGINTSTGTSTRNTDFTIITSINARTGSSTNTSNITSTSTNTRTSTSTRGFQDIVSAIYQGQSTASQTTLGVFKISQM